MRTSPFAVALRIFAVICSITLATLYISCRSSVDTGGPSPAEDPATGEPDVMPGSKSGGVVFPGSKSSPAEFNIGLFNPGESDENDEPEDEPVFLPGLKSEAVTPVLPGSKSLIIVIPEGLQAEKSQATSQEPEEDGE